MLEGKYLTKESPDGKTILVGELVTMDINTHLANVTGMERHNIRALRFSEVYGIQRDEIVSEVGERQVQIMTMRFLQKFPKVAGYARLKKSRARMMVEAMQTASGIVEKGNLNVVIGLNFFEFFYRGTPIVTWVWDTVEGDGMEEIDAGEFENTPSTRNQRKMVREAVEEFKKVALQL